MVLQKHFSCNAEANASELQENLEVMVNEEDERTWTESDLGPYICFCIERMFKSSISSIGMCHDLQHFQLNIYMYMGMYTRYL